MREDGTDQAGNSDGTVASWKTTTLKSSYCDGPRLSPCRCANIWYHVLTMSVHWFHELTRMSNIDSIQVTRCNTQARGVLSGVHISYVVLSRSQTARLVNVRWKQRTINELCNFTEHLISGDETTCTSNRGEDMGGGGCLCRPVEGLKVWVPISFEIPW